MDVLVAMALSLFGRGSNDSDGGHGVAPCVAAAVKTLFRDDLSQRASSALTPECFHYASLSPSRRLSSDLL